MVTLKEIIFICASIADNSNIDSPLKHQIYNEQSEKVSVLLTPEQHKIDVLNGCIEVGQKALDLNIDPILAIAVGHHESKFIRNIIGGGSIGMMQAIPKYWCKLEVGEDWDSPSQFLWLPIKPRPDKCKKKRVKVNQYMGEDCKVRKCDLVNCILKVCDLEKAGILALLANKKKNMREMLFSYNKGNTCNTSKDKDKCIKSGYRYADSIISEYKLYKKKLKQAK
jgi:hypothetical protein